MRARIAGVVSVALALSATAGCYCSHERAEDGGTPALDAAASDASMPIDAARADAGRPAGPAWIAVDIASFDVAYERCATREGQTLVLRVRVVTDGCDEPGQVRWSVNAMARRIELRPFVWRPIDVPPCPPSAREIERDVALRDARLSAGTWTIVGPDGSVLGTLEIDPAPEPACADCRADGEPCALDSECAGNRACVALRGDAVCGSFCAAVCQPFDAGASSTEQDLGCSERVGPAICADDPNLGWTCAASEPCTTTCPDGMACGAGVCGWETTAWPTPCAADADCPAGRSCVEMPAGGVRSCEIRCRGDHPCPEGEHCGPGEYVCPSPKI